MGQRWPTSMPRRRACPGTAPRVPGSPLELGLLAPGDQLPTAQQVVAKLAITPNTVLKAYRDLEREGLVRARPGLGSFIVRSLPRRDPIAQAGTPLMPRRPPILHPLPRPAGLPEPTPPGGPEKG
jgi:DNA-binding transcriptional MocR family regulator